jgi:hypothetical protein
MLQVNREPLSDDFQVSGAVSVFNIDNIEDPSSSVNLSANVYEVPSPFKGWASNSP